jgi:tetratricopeptide (TPR) repeat protein
MGATSSTLRLTNLSSAEISKLAAAVGEEYLRYEQLIIDHDISGTVLAPLTDEEMKTKLKSIGISNTAHQSMLVAQFKKLKYGTVFIHIPLTPDKVFHPDELDSSYFPPLGIQVSFLQEFIIACPGGRDGIAELTTNEVTERLVKPFTEPYKLSFCDLLHQSGHPGIGKATVFISHAWKYKFVDLADALQRKFADTLDTVVWFDVFSVNQHTTSQKDFGWWSETFQEAIRQFGHTVMVLSPWQDPVPLTRAWCLWELYCTVNTKCRFDVAFSERVEQDFLREVNESSLNTMKSKIDVERSECWLKEDKEKIFAAIKRNTSFSNLNTTVFNTLRGWMTGHLADLTLRHPEDADMLFKEASLLQNNGDYSKAAERYQTCLAIQREVLGPQHPSTLVSMGSLALVLRRQGKVDEAKTLYEKCLAIAIEVLGPRNPTTLTLMNSLAKILRDQGKYNEAESLHREEFAICKEVEGPRHPDTLTSMNSLAVVLRCQGKYNEAESLHREEVVICKEVQGPRHPDTLVSMNALACVLSEQGKYDEAKTLYEECLVIKREVLGSRHPATLTTMNNLALVLSDQGKYDEAKTLYEECLAIKREVLGPRHPDTLISINNLAGVLSDQGRVGEAKTLYEESLAIQREVLGPRHPDTLVSINNLALVLSYEGKVGEAKTLYEESLAIQREVLGPKHPHTLITEENLASLRRIRSGCCAIN